ncbi:CARDB domain-containing protein, partial [Hymenobacter norwichensis]|uniref:CARDB domain-containing protein n=1 Tax=Hymenobacter norwichensis TaxID=223903 RepID=UPI000527ECB2
SAFDDTVVEVYSGTCGSLTSIGCNDDIVDGVETFSSLVVRGQTAGNTVYVRVFGFDASVGTGQFNICVTLPPANDNCAGAISLTTGTTCTVTTGTNAGATNGTTPVVSCGNTSIPASNDVWYSTVVPAGGSLTVTTSAAAGSALDDTVLELYTGTCGSLTSIACNDDANAATLFSSATVTGLTVGSTVYIRVFGYDGDVPTGQFGICANVPPVAPANDNPAGAITLPVASTCTPVSGTNAGATTTPVNGYVNGTNPNAACGIAVNPKDVWYKFTTAASGAGSTSVAIQVTGGAAGYLRLFSATSATGPFTEIACSSGGTNNTVSDPLVAASLTPNTTYYVFVAGYGSNDTQGAFTICATLPAPDAAVQVIYSVGKAPVSAPRTVQAIIRNAGTLAMTNVPVTLSVTGANSFTDIKLIPSLAPGASSTVTFATYTPATVGNNTLTVSVPADVTVSNNTLTYTQAVTANSLSYIDDTQALNPSAVGVGAAGTEANGILAVKYAVNSAATIGEVKAAFTANASTTSTYQVVIFSATAAGLPDAVLFTSPTLNRPTAAGVVTIPVTGNVAVNGTFFVGVKQIAGSVALAYQVENPLRPATFYFQEGGIPTWNDLNITSIRARLALEVGFSTRVLSKRDAQLEQALSVFPNPAHGQFTLRLP